MSHILLVDDNPDHLEVRSMILEEAGHRVATAGSVSEALLRFDEQAPDTVIMDLRLPRPEDGLALIRHLRAAAAHPRIVVVSGWTADLVSKPEAAMVDHVLQKPVKSAHLLGLLQKLALCFLIPLSMLARSFPFTAGSAGEVVAELELSSASEGAVAALSVDQRSAGSVVAFLGPRRHTYLVLLGAVQPGNHSLSVAEGVQVHEVRFRHYPPEHPDYDVVANAPFLHARPNTIGKFTDVPLLAYCERLDGHLQYSIIFSNEDGGTSTRALMARWGRTTDIEHVYRFWPQTSRAIIQTKGHADIDFSGRREAAHPLLYVSTDNNMVAPEGPPTIRYQPAPVVVDLSGASRELVMDQHPFTYGVAARELEREGKLRPFGAVDGQKISDPRNYLYIEARIRNSDSRIAARVRLNGESRWRTSHLGRTDYAIERDGWIRTTVELPPGTRPTQIAEIGFDCLVEPPSRDKPSPVAGICEVHELSRVFLLDTNHQPGANLWSTSGGCQFPSGETITWALNP